MDELTAPSLTSTARKMVVFVICKGLVYNVLPAFGSLPSVVYLISAPSSLVIDTVMLPPS